MTADIVKKEQTALANPNQDPFSMMVDLLSSGSQIDTSTMKELFAIRKEYEAEESRKAFASDFTEAQSNIAAVVKTKNNDQTRSKYAGLDDVIEMSRPVYTKYGFSIIFSEGKADEPGHVRVCAEVLHSSGHTKPYYYDVPLDGVGIKGNRNMTSIHGKASSVSYGRRYLMCMIWNIPTADNDGNGDLDKSKINPPNKQEQAVIDAICDKLPKKDGLTPNKDAITKQVYFANLSKYPTDMKRVPGAVEWLIKNRSDAQLYTDRSKFEQDYEIE